MAYLDNIRTFVRVYELGNMSAAARDLRVSAAVASAARLDRLPQVSHWSTAPSLSNKQRYPYFARVINSDSVTAGSI
ncbi:MAG: hypothetical protein VX181_10330, partial [Pseudomonadota bacterium]|nr:hypothetical protein [Pseudomonadota bacterium]